MAIAMVGGGMAWRGLEKGSYPLPRHYVAEDGTVLLAERPFGDDEWYYSPQDAARLWEKWAAAGRPQECVIVRRVDGAGRDVTVNPASGRGVAPRHSDAAHVSLCAVSATL